MGRLGTQAVYASPVQSPARTQDSLPVVGQTLPGGLDGPLGSSERFLRCFLHRFPPFPGLPWRKRAPVRNPAVPSLAHLSRVTTARRSLQELNTSPDGREVLVLRRLLLFPTPPPALPV